MGNGYINVNNWHDSCNQPTNRIAWYFLRTIKSKIIENQGFFCLAFS